MFARPLLHTLNVKPWMIPLNRFPFNYRCFSNIRDQEDGRLAKPAINGRLVDPDKFKIWSEKILADQATKEVSLKAGLTRIKFHIHKDELDEKFVKGFGPGGQKTNKSNNCVILTHLPTGEQVKCHDSRDQLTNRKIALKILYDRLDIFLNPDTSKAALRVERKQRSKQKAI